MEKPTALEASKNKFAQWGHSNAQFLAVGLAFVWSISYLTGKFQQLQDQRKAYETKLKAARAEATQQKAEAIKQCFGSLLP